MRLGLTRSVTTVAAIAMLMSATCLPNGAWSEVGAEPGTSRLYMFPQNDTDRLDVHVFVPYRSEVPGLAHYVEHLAWHSATKDWVRQGLGRTGAWANAHTMHYWISARNGNVDELVGTIRGVFKPIALSERFALTEREIILREYRQREIENPLNQLLEETNVELYSGNPVAVPVLGNPKDIEALDLSQARKLHSDTHLVSSAAFLVYGNVSESAALRALGMMGLQANAGDAAAIRRPKIGPFSSERIVVHLADDDPASHVLWRRVVRLKEETPYEVLASRAGLLGLILRANRPGGLAKALQFDQAVARSLRLWLHVIDDQHVELSFQGHPDQGVTLPELVEAFERALVQTARSGIPRKTHEKVVGQHVRQWPDWEDEAEVSKYMKALAIERLSEWRQPPDVETVRNLHGQLELSKIDGLLRQLSGDGRTVVAFIGREGAAEGALQP
ncbi:MAG: insulinase family protein [Boseongicola sp. SB0677_bin_26]|nr:insulinase family protein [Boseongicola sp. SB0677_bin_26]